MCGRYTLTIKHRPELNRLGLQQADRYNIAPQSDVLVLKDRQTPELMRWDYSPPWAKEPMHISNARSETLREKPAFKGASRCVFLADGWYEWQRKSGQKTPWYHHMQGELLFFAGIYNAVGCAIVTRAAHPNIAHIHHRQPVLLDQRAIGHWLEGHDLFASAITRGVLCHPVSTIVNRPQNDSPALISAVESPTPRKPQANGSVGDLFD
jgi:putative SOS response-associated peptidase YedK